MLRRVRCDLFLDARGEIGDRMAGLVFVSAELDIQRVDIRHGHGAKRQRRIGQIRRQSLHKLLANGRYARHVAALRERLPPQNRREKPMNSDAVPLVSGSMNGLFSISSGRLLYLRFPNTDHFSPSGRKNETPICGMASASSL